MGDSSLSLKISSLSLSLSVSEQHLLLLTLRPCVLLLTIFVFSTSPALLLYALLSPTALMTSQPRPHSYFLSSFFFPPSFFITRYLSLAYSHPLFPLSLRFPPNPITRITALTNQPSENVPTAFKIVILPRPRILSFPFLSLFLLFSAIPLAGTTGTKQRIKGRRIGYHLNIVFKHYLHGPHSILFFQPASTPLVFYPSYPSKPLFNFHQPFPATLPYHSSLHIPSPYIQLHLSLSSED